MANQPTLILGEHHRLLDERYRVALPAGLVQQWESTDDLVLVKERPGSLSLWSGRHWQPAWDQGTALIESKLQAGRLAGRLGDLQLWGRLRSTRQRAVRLTQRSRLLVPEGFREFLGVDPGGGVMVVGAAVCVEIWHPENWREHLAAQIATFRELEDNLSA